MNTRVFFVTDVHGSERCFKKFLNAGKFYKANAVMLAGDITGKMIVPIVKQPDAHICPHTQDRTSGANRNLRSKIWRNRYETRATIRI
jgi:Icc-related predicted phosphoesterase